MINRGTDPAGDSSDCLAAAADLDTRAASIERAGTGLDPNYEST
jgi:hypothetical protein